MTADRTASAPDFFEVVLEGVAEAGRGFLCGLLLGSGQPGYLEFPPEQAPPGRTLGNRLRGMVGLSPHECRAIVDQASRDRLVALSSRLESEAGLRLSDEGRVRAARFLFRYQAFARRYGEEIQTLLKGLPAGLTVDGGGPVETVDPEATGLEAYSPAHEYEISGEGSISGRVDLVIEARRRLAEHPLVHAESLEIERD
ncbi:MAG: hypothetical protein ACYDIE_12655 [Candidatus Krumholzibacteriia bacterium]